MNSTKVAEVLMSTPFSAFFRNASSREKKRVYLRVLVRASKRQEAILKQARLSKVTN
jgi:BarA-like signal transduction histidine kinase